MPYLGKAERDSSGQTEQGFFTHSATITGDNTIPNGYNALSAGPITIATNATITIGTNSNWVILGQ